MNPNFGIDPQARLDYGYQAVATLTPMAKAAITTAYGKGPDRSYFGGCSNGGRHAMVAAARFADQYDGFIVGNPGTQLPKAAVANSAGGQASPANAPAQNPQPNPQQPTTGQGAGGQANTPPASGGSATSAVGPGAKPAPEAR